jgi:hypothetical protein
VCKWICTRLIFCGALLHQEKIECFVESWIERTVLSLKSRAIPETTEISAIFIDLFPSGMNTCVKSSQKKRKFLHRGSSRPKGLWELF